MSKELIVVDVESDGPCPGLYSMVCFGAVVVDKNLNKIFEGKIKPISNKFCQQSLSISGYTRQQHEKFDEPVDVMHKFYEWIIQSTKSPIFISDNNGYDWQFINYYFHAFYGKNPFGWSSRRISDLWCGYKNDMHAKWKNMRKTKHTHNPVDDALGNAEALLEMKRLGLNLTIQ